MPTNAWPRLRRRAAILSAVALVGLVAAVAPGAASADDAPQPCSQASAVFAPWGDTAAYAPTVQGTLETTASWRLTGGAALVDGNEPFFVGSPADAHSLALPDDSSATTHIGCVGGVHPQVRLFARNTGSPASTLRVDVLAGGAPEPRVSTTVAVLSAGPEWAPTAPIAIPVPTPADGAAMGTLRVAFTPQGAGGGWQIDDVFVDPYKQS